MEIVNVTFAGDGYEYQNYSSNDTNLFVTNLINTKFGNPNDYIEYHIYDENGEYLDVSYDVFKYYPNNPNSVSNLYSSLTLDPQSDLFDRGYNRGKLNIQYSFLTKLFNSSNTQKYWIKEISPSRTELRLASQDLSDMVISSGFLDYQRRNETKNYFSDFYLNFGNNRLVICTNVAFVETDNDSYLLIKLYEPLPSDFDIKSQLWIVDKLAESVSYDVDIKLENTTVNVGANLRGPNFKIPLDKKIGQTTPYYNYSGLYSASYSGSTQKMSSYYDDKAISINLDFSEFSNFIKFSSAKQRIDNFVYKLENIEKYTQQISVQKSIINGGKTIITSSINLLNGYIDEIIKKFDIYEYALYYNSASYAWPKSTTVEPYSLYSVSSSQATQWYSTASYSAQIYDELNQDHLIYIIPQYILDDTSNTPYFTFVQMVGQHFDNIWVYYRDVTNRYNATNATTTGISEDLVADALKGLGFTLYTNTNISNNLYYSMFGINPDGSLLPPTGSEVINTYVTSSIPTIGAKDLQNEIYKRIYHNLPLLIKSKGTRKGIQYLINCYGIPEDILTINEFGGYNRYETSGIYEVNNNKINIITSSVSLLPNLLDNNITVQNYTSDYRLNITDLEVGFSPADQLNRNISASLGYFNIDQLIGDVGNQYSSSYIFLDDKRDTYFAAYTFPHSLYEYIRQIKYYNNSVFKTIRDFVPARASVSAGIIIKPHILERSKYKRTDPIVAQQLDISQSIALLTVSASYGGTVWPSTNNSGLIVSELGYIQFTSSNGVERYTGELGGARVDALKNNGYFPQQETSSNSTTLTPVVVNYGATYQNVSQPVRSKRFFDLDYSSNQNIPVNLNIITQSMNNSVINNYATYNDPYAPYAYVQDYYWYTNAWTVPRYYGSKTISSKYSTYTIGDKSYGKTAAIDKIKYQYAYLVDIYTSSFFMPYRSNAQIKYIIDNNQNVLDLTKANENIFTVQNVFKSQETTDISLFQYDELNPYSQKLVNNSSLQIYEGGFRYLPILHNILGNSISQSYELESPIEDVIQGAITPGVGPQPSDPQLNITNWNVYWWAYETVTEPCGPGTIGTSNYDFSIKADYIGPVVPMTYPLQLVVKTRMNLLNRDCSADNTEITIQIPINTTQGETYFGSINDIDSNCAGDGGSVYNGTHWPKRTVPNCFIDIDRTFAGASSGGGGSTFSSTILTTFVTSSQPCMLYNSGTQQAVFNSELTYYREKNPVFDSNTDLGWSGSIHQLDRVVLPFSLSVGDKISLYNTASLGWDERYEYTIKNVSFTGSGLTGSRTIVDLATPIDGALLTSMSQQDTLSGATFQACRYIVWKHMPDETNVMLRYNPKSPTLIENGLLFPQYLDEAVRKGAGNTVKSLKAQNLLF